MKNEKLLKLNILAAMIVLSMTSSTIAANTIYSPGTDGGGATSPLTDPALNPNISMNTNISADAAAKISQIEIQGPAANVASAVTTPQATQVATTTGSATNVNNTAITNTYSVALQNAIANNLALSGVVPSSFGIMKVAGEKEPTITAPAYILVNATTRHIYAYKDMNARYEPAGLANLFTAYLAAQKFKMDTVLEVHSSAVKGVDKDASLAAIDDGDKITFKDALASMFIKGCVDSANVVAENYSGTTVDDFVKYMNTSAQSMGLTSSYFVNPSGINNEAQTCSALDMAVIMSRVCQNQELVDLLGLSQYTLPAAKRRDKLTLYTKNSQLVKTNSTYNADVVASRMGYNSKARYCIASLMNYSGNQIIAILFKANGSQFSDTKKLLEFGKIACTEDMAKSQAALTTTAAATTQNIQVTPATGTINR